MQTRKSSSSRIDPSGTPVETSLSDESDPFNVTYHFQLFKYD